MFNRKSCNALRQNLRNFSSKIVKSRYTEPLLATDVVNGSFTKFLMRKFNDPNKSSKVALIDATTAAVETRTYPQLYNHAYNVAELLKTKYKVGPNTAVGIFSPNCINYYAAMHGIALADGFSMCISSTFTFDEVMYQLEMTNTKVLFTHPSCLKVAEQCAEKLKIPLINITGDNCSSPYFTHSLNKEVLLDSSSHIDINAYGRVGGDGLLTVPFSSGTTGIIHNACVVYVCGANAYCRKV